MGKQKSILGGIIPWCGWVSFGGKSAYDWKLTWLRRGTADVNLPRSSNFGAAESESKLIWESTEWTLLIGIY